ncbi:MAG: transporter substrate-binding domain-containing protein [Chloroflexi bacterium]|nr:transporter substrate-binding domain-containing protein [Chloroflexota bacterium]
MKGRLVASLAMFALVVTACTSSGGASPSAVGGGALPNLNGREITVAVENAYLPFNYIDPATKQGAGWDYDAVNDICKRLNCKPKFVETGWDGMIQAVSDGQYDMAADGITITPERAEVVAFSRGYIAVEQKLMVRKDENRFSSLADVKSGTYIIGTQIGTTNYETAKKEYTDARIKAFDQFAFAVQALINKDVDAVIIDSTAGQGYVGENADQIKLLDGSLSSDQLGFVFPLKSDLVGPVNAALAAMEADGTLAKLADKFFTDKFTITYDDLG